MNSDEQEVLQRLVRRALGVAWSLLFLSSLSLLISIYTFDGGRYGDWLSPILLMVSRGCGIATFLIGALGIFNGLWGQGTALFIGSILLPLIAYHVFGTV